MQPFAVIVKPVGSRCNMRCSYCYYLEKDRFSAHEQQSVMSDALLERLISQTIAASPGPMVSFTWHGGEPTLAGLDFYRRVVELQKKYLPEGWQAWNNLQTNGLLLDRDWCRFLAENRFDVGVSVDGSELIHDRNRRDLGGNATYDRVRRSVERLMKAGIAPDLLCTVTSDSAADPLGTYRALRDLGSGWMQFIPVLVRQEDGTMSPQSVSPEAYGDFLVTIFDEWTRNDLGKVDVQLFAETARVFAGGNASLCTLTPECGRIPVVEEDGGVYSCDHFVDPEHRLGYLRDETALAEYMDSAVQRDFGESKRSALTAQCRACPYLACCGGGCKKDRYALSRDGESGHYALCEGLLRFYRHADEPLHLMMKWSRKGLTNEQIMKKWR